MIKYAIRHEMEVAIATKCNIRCTMMHQLCGDINSEEFGAGLQNCRFCYFLAKKWTDFLRHNLFIL